jgi:acyl-CoA synthetase (AMP-forming)/AMP-acid ligase II
MRTALAQALEACLKRRAHDPVVTICAPRPGQPHERLTGAMLDDDARNRADALSAAFDPSAGPIAIVMPSGADFVVTMLGALYGGFTIAPLAPPRPGTQADRFNRIVEDCRPAAILCTDGLVPRIETARAGVAKDEAPPIVSLGSLGSAERSRRSRNPGSDRPAILQYTSGSTRAPRGVMLDSPTVLANAALANRTWGMDEHGTMLSWLPHFHDMGLLGGILYPLLSGGVTALMDPLHMTQRPERWLHLIGELGATFSGGPAFAFAHCLHAVRDDQCEGLDLSSWRKAFCGAEPVPTGLMDAFRARFAPLGLDPAALFASYGLAEYTLMVAGGSHPPLEAPPPTGCETIEPCQVADAMRDNLRIVDPETLTPVADGEPGEIWLRGGSVASGYLGRAAETQAVFQASMHTADPALAGPWLRTGDLATLLDGYLYVTGRLKDLIFVNGRKVPASDIEWLAAQKDPALNPMAAAALMPDELANGKAVLLIERRRRGLQIDDEDAARRRIGQAVAGAWAIELTDIRFLAPNTLPRTTSGKVQRQLAARAYRDHGFAAGTT